MNNMNEDNKSIIIKIIFSVFLGLIFVGFFLLFVPKLGNNNDFKIKQNQFNQSEQEIKDEKGLNKKDNSQENTKEKKEVVEEKEINLEGKYPIEFYNWANKPFNEDTFWAQENIYNEIYETIENEAYAMITAISWMPTSEGDGINEYIPKTNDVNKKMLDDGSPNPNFSYTLSEDYYKTFIVTIERILNPEFGNWDAPNQFNDIIDKEWLNKNGKFTFKWNEELSDKYKLPQLYDNRFFGRINKNKEIEINEDGVDSRGQPILNIDVPIDLLAFDKEGEIVSIKGNLKFTMLSNEDPSNINNRVIVKNINISPK